MQSVYQKMSEFPSDIESHVQIIHNEENGLPEVIITHQYIYGLETSTHEILRNCCQKNGHKNGNGWEYPEDEYFQQVLLSLANKALVDGDTNKLDAYLGLEYWSDFYMGKLWDIINDAKRKNEPNRERACTMFTTFAKANFRCKALYFAIWHKNIALVEYILSKISPCNITDADFEVAKIQGFGSYIVNKDPSRYYMRRHYDETTGEYTNVPEMRTEKDRKYYFERKYEVLAIHHFSELTTANLLIRKMPKDILRQIIQMV